MKFLLTTVILMTLSVLSAQYLKNSDFSNGWKGYEFISGGNARAEIIRTDGIPTFVLDKPKAIHAAFLRQEFQNLKIGDTVEVTARIRSTASRGQIILTEGFRWCSAEKVKRLIRAYAQPLNQWVPVKLTFPVRELPLYFNAGILNESGKLEIRELSVKILPKTEQKKEKQADSSALRPLKEGEYIFNPDFSKKLDGYDVVKDGNGIIRSSPEGAELITWNKKDTGLIAIRQEIRNVQPGDCLIVRAKVWASTANAQLMISEDFRWGTPDRVRRFARASVTNSAEWQILSQKFRVEKCPVFLNFGIMWDTGRFLIRQIEIAKVSPEEYRTFQPNRGVVGSMNPLRELSSGMIDQILLSEKLRNAPGIPAAVKEKLRSGQENIKKQMDPSNRIAELKSLMNSVESPMFLADGRLNPRNVRQKTVMTLVNTLAPRPLWIKINSEIRGLKIYQISKNGKIRFELNNGSLIQIPTAGSAYFTVELPAGIQKGEIRLLGLDHVSEQTERKITIEA